MRKPCPFHWIKPARKSVLLLPISLVLLGGCVTVPRDGDFATVERLVGERIPQKVHWSQDNQADAQVQVLLDDLLSQPLTARAAVQIALLNNRHLQSEYESLGIAQADLIQAGLLSNPVLFASIRFPSNGASGNNTEFDLTQGFLDILLRSARQRVANVEFERVKLRVANSVLELASAVQTQFVQLQGEQQRCQVLAVATDAAQTSYDLAQQFDKAGNLSELELAQQRSAAAEMTAALMRSRAAVQSARDKLNVLLGLVDDAQHWTLTEELMPLPSEDPNVTQMQEMAIERRLDLDEKRQELIQLTEALNITRQYRWLGGASVGVSTERDADGSRVSGPNFSVELPIFDQRQAAIARLESTLAQSRSRLVALSIDIRRDVISAGHQVRAAREIVEYYRDDLIPAQEQVVKYTQQEQNYMLVDVFELLFARRQATQSYLGYIDGLTEYWEAITALARASGAGLPEITNTKVTPSMSDEHAEHSENVTEPHHKTRH